MQYEYSGKVEVVGPTQTVGSKGFQKREFVVQTEGSKYPCPVKFTLKKDKCSLGDSLRPGMDVTVKFAIEGRMWDGRGTPQYFVDLVALDVKSPSMAGGSVHVQTPAPAVAPAMDMASAPSEDLPF